MGEAQKNKNILIWVLIAVGAIVIYKQRSEPRASESGATGSTKASSTATSGSVDNDAEQVVRALRRLWAPASKSTALRRAHDKCENEKGYKPVRECWSRLAREANQLESSISTKPETTGTCSLQFENAAIAHVVAVKRYLDESARWLEARDAAFQRKQGKSTPFNYCNDNPTWKECTGWHSGLTKDARPEGYSNIDCTKQLFQCAGVEASEHPCGISGVADRLGLNPTGDGFFPNRTSEAPADRLYVRSTGKRIFPY